MLAIALILSVLVTCHPRLDDQVASLTARLESSPNSIELLTQRGVVYYQSHEFDKALADFEYALALSPNNPALIRHKAATLQQAGFPLSSLALLNLHIASNSTDADAFLLRARICVTLVRFSDAIADFEKVLELAASPRPEIFLELANVYSQSGDLKGCNRTLSRGVERIGPLAHFLEPLARSQIALADFDQAQMTIKKLSEASPGSFAPALLDAERLESMGNHDEAIRAFSEVIRAIDQSPQRTRTNESSQSCRNHAAQAVSRLSTIKDSIP